jgi:histidine ammonia-lyase
LTAKEGLALINGTQLITALGVYAVITAEMVARQADVVTALTIEALKASVTPFHASIHKVRPHKGQQLVAGRLRNLLKPTRSGLSEIASSHADCGKVQDSYTLRCVPQIHGITHDTIKFVYDILTVECNSATDNPMIFADLNHYTLKQTNASYLSVDSGVILSGGNFHGEYPAKALDYLTIGIHEIASVSERRIERLVNPTLSGLPAFLVNEGGLNSGYMIAHCTAAALVSENKTLCHPASVDSISTSAAQEDHVSMGGFAARKCCKVVGHVEYVIAIELLCAVQAIEFLRPLRTTPALEKVITLVRSVVPNWEKDRYMAPDIEAVVKLLQHGKIWECVKDTVAHKYHHLHVDDTEETDHEVNSVEAQLQPSERAPVSKL